MCKAVSAFIALGALYAGWTSPEQDAYATALIGLGVALLLTMPFPWERSYEPGLVERASMTAIGAVAAAVTNDGSVAGTLKGASDGFAADATEPTGVGCLGSLLGLVALVLVVPLLL